MTKDIESRLGTAMGETIYSPVTRDSKGNIYAPDIHEAAEKAVRSGAGSIARGEGAVAAGEKGVAVETGGGAYVGGDIAVGEGNLVGRDQITITYDKAFERVIGSTAFVTNQLELSYAQTREQAHGWFRFSLMAAAVFFVQSKNANERVDVIQTRLTEAREIQTAVDIVNTIDDGKFRDRLKIEIVRKALRFKGESPKGEGQSTQ
jgi:hypothetical protein